MRATGLVCRIDDLGRILIPKEIRKRLNIKDGDPFELYLDGEAIILKKYSFFENSCQAVENALRYIVDEDDLPPSLSNVIKDKLKEVVRMLKESEDRV